MLLTVLPAGDKYMKTPIFISVLIASCLIFQACDRPENQEMPDNTDTGKGVTESGQAKATITAEVLRSYVAEISDDRYEGRGPASRGDILAREYLANQLAMSGFKPGAADGGWQQEFDLVGITAQIPETWAFKSNGEDLVLKAGEQFVASSGVQSDRAVIDQAGIVFVGYGITAPEYGWDDFKGQDLRGKVLLMLNNDPDWDEELFEGNTRLYYGRWSYKYESAARQGAAGAIIIHTRASAGYPYQVVRTSWAGEQFELPYQGEPRIQVAAWLSEDAAGDLARLAGHDLAELVESAKSRDFKPVPLGITTTIELQNKIQSVRTANVLGLMPGSDPSLSDEVVVYSAHHDHFGIGPPDESGDNIYNGARDNGAGVATVLSIARAFSTLSEKPRRSILIAFVAAEEQGLLGSEYYAAHPTFPPGKIAANINYDSGNIWGRTRDLTMLGYGKSSLDDVVESLAALQGRTVKPDQLPDRGFYYRSDQFNFARIGVPSMYIKTGSEFIDRPAGWGKQQIEYYEDNYYHQPSDELRDDWNFEGMVDDARLGFQIGLTIANSEDMPAWNPGDEFESVRKKALAEAADGGSTGQ